MRLRHCFFYLAIVAGAARLWAHPEVAAAIIDLTGQIAAHPSEPGLFLRRAECFQEHGDLALAEADLRQATMLAPGSLDVSLRLIDFLIADRRPGEAQQAIAPVLARNPENATALILRARLLGQLAQNERAYADYSRAISLLPEPRPELYLERAALPANPSHVLAGLNEGLARLGPVVALLDRAIALDLKLGRLDSALARLDILIASSERKESILKRRGDLLATSGRTAEARAAYQSALVEIQRLPGWLRDSADCSHLSSELKRLLKLNS